MTSRTTKTTKHQASKAVMDSMLRKWHAVGERAGGVSYSLLLSFGHICQKTETVFLVIPPQCF
jgi:hypothetical protein